MPNVMSDAQVIGCNNGLITFPSNKCNFQVDLDNAGLLALRDLQRKQEQELKDDSNPSSIEIRRRIVDMVHEMAQDQLI